MHLQLCYVSMEEVEISWREGKHSNFKVLREREREREGGEGGREGMGKKGSFEVCACSLQAY